MTYKECAALTGRSVTWLKTHQCGWCDQTALMALKYGCGSIFGPKCDPALSLQKEPPGAARAAE